MKNQKQSNISQLLLNLWKNQYSLFDLILSKNQKDLKVKNQYPAYALKSDDGKKPKRTNILAYAVTSDNGWRTEEKPISWPMP